MTSKVIADITAANKAYASNFTKGDLPLPPGREFTIVTCMDARLDPAKALGLEEGDAHVIRNAGGRAKDALRSVVISQQLLGTKEVLVIHHTDCGMLTFNNAGILSLLHERFEDTHSPIDDFLPFSNLEQSVRDDVQYIRDSGLVSSAIPISGWVYEVETGHIRPVS